MAHTVEITIHLIAGTQVYESSVNEWMESIGVKDYDPDFENKTSAELLTELAGRRCYMSFEPGLNPNVTKIREGIADYIGNILKSAHGSVLEHSTYTFAIEGVSRVFTGEMNRHRAGIAISEGSMRYIRFTDMGYWLPPSIDVRNDDLPFDHPITMKKWKSQQVFKSAFEDAEKHYVELQEIWKDELAPDSKFKAKKEVTSMMRRIVPMGVATGGVWTGNLRALRHIFTMRVTPHAEEEICYVFTRILKMISEIEPNIFGDFKEVEGGFFVPTYIKV